MKFVLRWKGKPLAHDVLPPPSFAHFKPTLWWRERALAKALAGLFGACGMLAALMRKARGADATQAG
ncbi:hypothetical protein PGTUg99_006134 [Puccinia graminis f. sp. tritici]|uniref:Uncharacterized protein n=1 Tax=Puccinia graminis f. sp. tritici TaxID=56615 RepID=A0A5B0RDR1_PUCGR|nr:hypothetical protein PGTUg99_006134 [Puccinia graminis f. sp. tritici]